MWHDYIKDVSIMVCLFVYKEYLFSLYMYVDLQLLIFANESTT